MRYLSLCCIVKEENFFIREWLAYHSLLGVEHFYIYDNGSRMPARDAVGEFAAGKLVTFHEAPGECMQLPVYNACLRDYGEDSKWIGFIDMDEFLCPHRDDDLRILLSEFEPYAALGVNWQCFSSNGHLRRPDMPVLEAYTEAVLYDFSLIKSIVQPRHTLITAGQPHSFFYKKGRTAFTDEHRPIPPGCPRAISGRKLVQINHYRYRSQQDFEEKIQRGRATTTDQKMMRSLDIFYEQAGQETRADTSALRFLPAVKKALRAGTLAARPFPWPAEAPFEVLSEVIGKLLRSNRLKEAELCLCVAALHHSDKAELWLMRAIIARLAGQLERAGQFLDQSLALEELPNAYLELFRLALAAGDLEDAEARLLGFEGFVDFFHKNNTELARLAKNERARFMRLASPENL